MMRKVAQKTRKQLNNAIKSVEKRKVDFTQNPEKDFTRRRKLPFELVINSTLALGGQSLPIEIMQNFNYDAKMPTVSAFIQQRDKISPEAFKTIFRNFSVQIPKTYKGYRLLAGDGSDVNISHNPADKDTHFPRKNGGKGFNQLHLNAMFDLLNKQYADMLVQPACKENERRAMAEMIDNSAIKDAILICDRGYENYNLFAHLSEKGWKYLVRIKDVKSTGIAQRLSCPKGEFDEVYTLQLTRRQTNEIKQNPDIYRFLPANVIFDYLAPKSKGFYTLTFRVVRFKITDNTYETIITNLDKINFPPSEIKALYRMRWGIETSFRELKYAIGLSHFHSKKSNLVLQEIYARLIMYNFCMAIALQVVVQKKHTKYGYQVNFTVAISICRDFFRGKAPPNIEQIIERHILPIRENRADIRKISTKSFVSFLYRVA